jgi:psiF repeat
MPRFLAIVFVPVMLVATPALAVTSQEKMETCKVGAESQQLQGAKRDAFIKKCMAGGNYEPPARKNAKQTAPKPQ